MAGQCPSCKSSSFELVEHVLPDSNFMINLVKCGGCDTVVGVLDQKPAWPKIEEALASIEELKQQVGDLAAEVNALTSSIRRAS